MHDFETPSFDASSERELSELLRRSTARLKSARRQTVKTNCVFNFNNSIPLYRTGISDLTMLSLAVNAPVCGISHFLFYFHIQKFHHLIVRTQKSKQIFNLLAVFYVAYVVAVAHNLLGVYFVMLKYRAEVGAHGIAPGGKLAVVAFFGI